MTTQLTRGTASVNINADAQTVWNRITDLGKIGHLSPECVRAEWMDGVTEAVTGAKIHGFNKAGDYEWDTVSTVISAQPGVDFSFAVVPDGSPATIWRYLITESDEGCEVTETFDCPAAMNFGPDRVGIMQANIESTLSSLKAELEA